MAKTGELPESYPAWAKSLAEEYLSGSSCFFLLHGNVHDLQPNPKDEGFCDLTDFLATGLFGKWDIVLKYDLGHGLRVTAGGDEERHRGMLEAISKHLGDPSRWPRDPDEVLSVLGQLVQRILMAAEDKPRSSLAILFDYAQFLVPTGGLEQTSPREASRLIQFLEWAESPYIRRVNLAFCLTSGSLGEINPRLATSPHVSSIEVPIPPAAQRAAFLAHELKDEGESKRLAGLTNGLSLVSLGRIAKRSKSGKVADDQLKQLKKSLIERQTGGLLEFVEPEHTLELVVGHEAAKQRLRDDSELLLSGKLDSAPMGYLFAGPVGTGKTFLAECYAGTVGIPCVKLRNFRSKYVGETESNLQHVLTVLRELGPVVVIIDEADATLGNRGASGDSGTSSRVFSMIAQQMGDTRFRGKILWMLLTCRPDLLPIDLKRQGRAEVHVPLLYPQNESEVRKMLLVMARKNKVKLTNQELPLWDKSFNYSGSDLESIVVAAKRAAALDGRDEIKRADLDAAIDGFLPSVQGLERELQEVAAVLECTDREFLPEKWSQQVMLPAGRAKLQERLVELRQLLRE